MQETRLQKVQGQNRPRVRGLTDRLERVQRCRGRLGGEEVRRVRVGKGTWLAGRGSDPCEAKATIRLRGPRWRLKWGWGRFFRVPQGGEGRFGSREQE